MSVLDRLSAAPGVYWGEGRGPGGGRFIARVCLRCQDDGTLTFDYEAWSPQGGLQHAESARFARTGSSVTMASTSNGEGDTMLFREGEPGVFGSVGSQRVGLVITTDAERLTFSWWWTGRDGQLGEQSRAMVAPMREIVPAPLVPGADLRTTATDQPTREAGPAGSTRAEDAPVPTKVSVGLVAQPSGPVRKPVTTVSDEPPADAMSDGVSDGDSDVGARLVSTAAARNAVALDGGDGTSAARSGANGPRDAGSVPWPGILVLHGAGTGLVAQRLAARLTRAAVVRTDLFDRAVRGTAGRSDPALRQRIALSVVQGYAATGHPVILHGASSRLEHEELVAAIRSTGLRPVRLVDVADGEDYGEVARRLIESD